MIDAPEAQAGIKDGSEDAGSGAYFVIVQSIISIIDSNFEGFEYEIRDIHEFGSGHKFVDMNDLKNEFQQDRYKVYNEFYDDCQ